MASQAWANTRRFWWLLAIILGVVVVHGWLTWFMAKVMLAQHPDEASDIKRMEAAYVSELKLSAPSLAAPAAPRSLARRQTTPKSKPLPPDQTASEPPPAALVPTETASAPALAQTVAEASTEASSSASEPAPQVATSAASATSEAAKGPPFVWPTATRVSYQVIGYFRGDVRGNATVEWVRQGSDYQVRVDTTIGPSFAPIGSWKLISAGVITPEGLSPRRFEQVNRLLIRTSAPRKISFEDQDVVLDSGERFRRATGMQDAASQFIQLSYQFIMNPSLLTPGNVIMMPLALPKKLETIAYDVIGAQDLDTPIGKVPTFHVKPRKMSAEGGVLPVEIWFAPGLQYLPVRILVKADEKTFMDLRMERAPEQTPAETNPLPGQLER